MRGWRDGITGEPLDNVDLLPGLLASDFFMYGWAYYSTKALKKVINWYAVHSPDEVWLIQFECSKRKLQE